MPYDEGLAERLREIMHVVPRCRSLRSLLSFRKPRSASGGSACEDIPPKGGTTNHIVTEKKMFGGLCFMVSGNMCCGIVDETLMARVGPDQYEECLKLPHAREMDFTGKPLKGLIYVDPEGIAEDEDLEFWIERCMVFMKILPAK